MNMYSGHDTTVMSLATALDVPIEFPNYSACIMVELYLVHGPVMSVLILGAGAEDGVGCSTPVVADAFFQCYCVHLEAADI